MTRPPKIHSVKFSIPKATDPRVQTEASITCKTLPDIVYLSIASAEYGFAISKEFEGSMIDENRCLLSAHPAATVNQAEIPNLRLILKLLRNKKDLYSFIMLKNGLTETFPCIKPIRINYFTAKTTFDISIDFVLSSEQEAFDSLKALGKGEYDV